MIKTFAWWMEELKRLKSEADASQVRLFRSAYEFETQYKEEWRKHYDSFDLLYENSHLGKVKLYRAFLASERIVGEQNANDIGSYATIEAAKISDPEQRQTYILDAADRRRDDGVPWSKEQAEKARKNLTGQPPRELRQTAQRRRMQQLQEENVQLKKEILRLKRELKERDEEIAGLKRKLENKRRVPSSGSLARAHRGKAKGSKS